MNGETKISDKPLANPIVTICFIFLLLTSCSTNNFERRYYEDVTKIKIPDNCKVLQTFDNGEWLTGTLLEFDSLTLQNFISNYKFDAIPKSNQLRLLSNAYWEEKHAPGNLSRNGILVIQGTKNKVFWTLVADTKENKLWIEISYPDLGGQ